MTPTAENVLETYRAASFAALSEGTTWYVEAQQFAASLDTRFHRSAGVIAALSPMNKWENNKRMAQRFYDLDGKVTVVKGQKNGIGLGSNVAKAIRIFNGEDALDVIPASSPKVRSFYLSIVDPTADVDPVIDRHAFDIAVGMRTNDKARAILSRKSVYASFVSVYREAAAVIGMPPKWVQAITWVSWKERHGI